MPWTNPSLYEVYQAEDGLWGLRDCQSKSPVEDESYVGRAAAEASLQRRNEPYASGRSKYVRS